MKQHENAAAYDGFENLDNFTEESFGNYRKAKLEGCRGEIELIPNYLS